MSAWWIWMVIAVTAIVTAILVVFLAARTAVRADHRATETRRIGPLKEPLGVLPRPGGRGGRRRSDHSIDRAAREAIRAGLLLFNIPFKMVQGEQERVEVRIGRSADLRDQMLSGLRGQGEPQVETIDTSLYMEVKLAGPTFDVISHSPSEQLIIPTPACWEFDVLPRRAGRRQITLHVSMRIEADGIVGGRRGVSVLEKQVDVQVNIGYATSRFVANNWQWLIPTALALAGAVAAWLVVPF